MTKAISKLEKKERAIITFIFVIIFSLLIFDVIEDLQAGSSWTHVGFEASILLLVIFGVIILSVVYFSNKHNINELSIDLKKARIDLNLYKSRTRSLAVGISKNIDDQLTSWNLTKAEKDISLLILKGLSNKEIGEIRNTSEKTVRQQISSIFQKSNLTSRLELSAFFLEDFLIAL